MAINEFIEIKELTAIIKFLEIQKFNSQQSAINEFTAIKELTVIKQVYRNLIV